MIGTIKNSIEKNFDIKIYIRPKIDNLHDVIIRIISPIIKDYDILTIPYIYTQNPDLNNISKGDGTTDLLTAVKKEDNYVYRKFMHRDFQYEFESSSPITYRSKVKPLSEQDVKKQTLYKEVFFINDKNKHSLSLASNYGLYCVIYKNKEGKKVENLLNFISYADLNNIYSFGSFDRFSFNNIPKNSIMIVCFHIEVTEENETWKFHADVTESFELEIDGDSLIDFYDKKDANNTDINIEEQISLKKGIHKIIARIGTKYSNNHFNLYVSNNNSSRELVSVSLPNKILYIEPKYEQLNKKEFIIDGFNLVPNLPNVEYILCKYNYIDDLYNNMEKNFVYQEIKDISIDVDSTYNNSNLNKNFLIDDFTLNEKGWASDTQEGNVPQIIINFNNPENNIDSIIIYEFSDFNKCGGFNSDLYRSSIIKAEITLNDDSIRYITEFDIDIKNSFNISNIKSNLIYKKNRNGITIIKFTDQFKNLIIKKIRIMKYVTEEEYNKWGLITEVKIIKKISDEIPFKIVLPNGTNMELKSYMKAVPIKFDELPINIEKLNNLKKHEVYYMDAAFIYYDNDSNQHVYILGV